MLLAFFYNLWYNVATLLKRGNFMKYYGDSSNENKKSAYITGVKIVKDYEGKKYIVSYANGDKDSNVRYIDENTKKINDRLCFQAQEGFIERAQLVQKDKYGTISRIGSGIGLLVSSSAIVAKTISSYGFPSSSTESILMLCAAGTIAVGGIILTVKGYKKHKEYSGLIKEINNTEFRLSNSEVVQEYLQTSPNAYLSLDGSNEEEKINRAGKLFDAMYQNKDPFSLLSLETGEGVTNEEMNRLLTRRAREANLGLSYQGGYSYQDVVKGRGNK